MGEIVSVREERFKVADPCYNREKTALFAPQNKSPLSPAWAKLPKMIASRHIEFVIVLLGSIVAIYLGSHLVMLPPAGMAIVISLIFVALWALTAGNHWWIPVLCFAALPGIFYLGVKVQSAHIAFAAAMVGIAPLLLVNKEKQFQAQRPPLPLVFYVTALYVAIRLGIDIIPAEGSRGNLSRVTFDYVWPFIFGFFFYHYGRLEPMRMALVILFYLLLFRTGCGLVGYFTGIPLYIPGINYVLSFGERDSLLPMRSVASTLMIVSLVFYHATRSFMIKCFLIPILLFAAIMLTMGAGRFATFLGLLLPLVFFAWSRRWLPVVLATLLAVGLVGGVNLFPQTLASLPKAPARALSGLIINKEEESSAVSGETEGSDEWHDALHVEGFKRLTSSPVNFFLGDGIHPSPDLYDVKKFSKDQMETVNMACNIGAYESGLLTILAVLGTVGFALYIFTFISLWRQVLPYFFRRPTGTLWEGVLFWGFYSSFIWFVVAYFQGGAPSFEMVVLLLAVATVHDGKLNQETPGPLPQPSVNVRASRLIHAGYPGSRPSRP